MTGVPTASGVAQASSLALQGDGKIVLAGSSGSGTSTNFAVARFAANGVLDSTFNGTGTVATAVFSSDDHANAVAIQGDGKIVAVGGGLSSSIPYFVLARYNANGSLDGTFGTGGVRTDSLGMTDSALYAVAIDGSGRIVAGGKVGSNGASSMAVIRYTTAGAPDVTFSGNGSDLVPVPTCPNGCVGQVQAIAIQSDGKVVVAGWSGPVGNSDIVLARYTATGTLDSTFGVNGVVVHALSSGNDTALALTFDSSQRIVVAGTTNPSGAKASYAIVRYLSNGSVDTTFGTNGVVITSISAGNDIASSIKIAADGKIVVGGDQNDFAGDFVVARYTANGILDNTFGCATAGSCPGYVTTNFAGTDQGKSVAIQGDGNIVLGGAAAAGTTSARFAVARYVGSGGVVGGLAASTTAVLSANPNPSAVNAAVTVTFSVAAALGGSLVPSGNVTVSDGAVSCTGTVASGQCSLTFTSSGTKSLTATYGGDANFSGSTSAAFSHSVSAAAAAATVTMSAAPTSVTLGGSSVISANVTGASGTPTGTVSVSGAGGSCVITLSSGAGSCTLTATIAGASQVITGSYSGNGTYGPSTGTTALTVTTVGASNSLTVTIAGTGNGRVTSSPASISCTATCTQTYAGATALALTATSSGSSVFTGWLGACTGTGVCNVTVAGAVNVSATFGPSSISPFRLDIDSNGAYDALTDGLLIMRYMFGVTGPSLTSGVLGTGATLTDPAQILTKLNNMRPLLDIDGNGSADALTDGLMIVRYMFGLRGSMLVSGAVSGNARRTTSTAIETYIQSLMP